MAKPNQELISKMSNTMPCVTQAYDQKHGTYRGQEPTVRKAVSPCCCDPFAAVKKR